MDRLEMSAWEAWVRSCEEEEVSLKRVEEAPKVDRDEESNAKPSKGAAKPKVGDAGNELVPIKVTTEQRRTGRVGNPAFLSQIAWCIEQRLKLMGCYKQPDGAPGSGSTTNVTINWNEMTVRPTDPAAIVQDRINKAMARARAAAGGQPLALPQQPPRVVQPDPVPAKPAATKPKKA